MNYWRIDRHRRRCQVYQGINYQHHTVNIDIEKSRNVFTMLRCQCLLYTVWLLAVHLVILINFLEICINQPHSFPLILRSALYSTYVIVQCHYDAMKKSVRSDLLAFFSLHKPNDFIPFGWICFLLSDSSHLLVCAASSLFFYANVFCQLNWLSTSTPMNHW